MFPSKIDTVFLPPYLLSYLQRIDEFNGVWKAVHLLAPDKLSRLRKTATIESIGASTRIEGVTLTDTQIETLLSNLSITSFASRDEQEVAGYADLMAVIFDQHEALDIQENHIKQLHSILLKYSVKDEPHRGNYKTSTNSVGAFLDGKLQAIIFETSSPFETPFHMEQLMTWYEKACAQNWHPLLITGVFVVVFLAIHPFQDGNGRLSRALTTLLLLKFKYAYAPYFSLEHLIEDNKADYYKALQQTQITLRKETPNFTPWLTFFFQMLDQQIHLLHQRIEDINLIQKMPPLSTQIIEALETHHSLSVKQLSDLLGVSRHTVRSHLYNLVKNRFLITQGSGRSVTYSLNKP